VHSAVAAHRLYKRMARMNGICAVEDERAQFSKNRGREWEVSTQPGFSRDRLEGDDLLRWFHATPAAARLH
jgi:hypothetical protein